MNNMTTRFAALLILGVAFSCAPVTQPSSMDSTDRNDNVARPVESEQNENALLPEMVSENDNAQPIPASDPFTDPRCDLRLGFVDVIFSESGTATLIASNGFVHESTDNGRSWNSLGRLNMADQPGSCSLLDPVIAPDGCLWGLFDTRLAEHDTYPSGIAKSCTGPMDLKLLENPWPPPKQVVMTIVNGIILVDAGQLFSYSTTQNSEQYEYVSVGVPAGRRPTNSLAKACGDRIYFVDGDSQDMRFTEDLGTSWITAFPIDGHYVFAITCWKQNTILVALDDGWYIWSDGATVATPFFHEVQFNDPELNIAGLARDRATTYFTAHKISITRGFVGVLDRNGTPAFLPDPGIDLFTSHHLRIGPNHSLWVLTALGNIAIFEPESGVWHDGTPQDE